jgi:hypothetical protein
MDDQWSSELFSALSKWIDLLVLIREETICLPTRSQRSKLLLFARLFVVSVRRSNWHDPQDL